MFNDLNNAISKDFRKRLVSTSYLATLITHRSILLCGDFNGHIGYLNNLDTFQYSKQSIISKRMKPKCYEIYDFLILNYDFWSLSDNTRDITNVAEWVLIVSLSNLVLHGSILKRFEITRIL